MKSRAIFKNLYTHSNAPNRLMRAVKMKSQKMNENEPKQNNWEKNGAISRRVVTVPGVCVQFHKTYDFNHAQRAILWTESSECNAFLNSPPLHTYINEYIFLNAPRSFRCMEIAD